MACVRVWQERELTERVAEFATTVQGLLALRDWLEALVSSRSRWRDRRLLEAGLARARRRL